MARLLVIDTATPACSVALFDGEQYIGGDFRKLGRGHAEHLVGMIAALPGKGKAEEIFVNCGPGSFTGIRVGLAAAKALGLAWQANISGYSGLQLAAIMASANAKLSDFDADNQGNIFIANIAGHGELFGQLFGPSAQPVSAMLTLAPEAMVQTIDANIVAGTGLELLPGHEHATALHPDARCFPANNLAIIKTLPAAPVYGRAPDAVPSAALTSLPDNDAAAISR